MFISCYVFLQVYLSLLISCSVIDVITINSASLSDEKGETLVSAGKIFELGFFTPDGNSDGQRYVGIWYYGLSGKNPIWVANRDAPLSDSRDGVLGIDDGNLKIKDGSGIEYWSTNLKPTQYRGVAPRVSTPGAWEVKLSDSGNLIVGDRQGQSVWQSFQNPTDTFLPGMKMDEDLSLTSWKSQDDPGKGNFTFKQEREHQVSINKSDYGLYWKSDWFYMEKISTKIGCLLSNFSSNVYCCKTSSQNCSLPELDYNNTRMVMNSSGEIQLWNLAKDRKEWLLQWLEPRDKCSVVKACGNFGICNSNNQLTCECLPGYKPKFQQDWNQKIFLGGCVRNSEVFCQNDIFLNLTDIRVETTDIAYEVESETACKNMSLRTCQNQAYSYTGGQMNDLKNCFIWTDNMNNLQDYPVVVGGGGVPVTAVRLSVRVTPSDIGLTARSCDPCGKNVIPYPLSSESSCGDPMYFSFACDKSTGKISFKTQNSTYDVKNINSSSRSFVILAGASDNCTARTANDDMILLSQSLPFTLLNVSCDAPIGGNYSSSVPPPKRMNEIEISWKPPPEPTCGRPADCMDWPYSACNVTGNGTGRCICNKSYWWDRDNLNCTHVEETSPIVQTVPPSRGASRGEIRVSIAVGATIAGIIVISSTIVFIYISRRKKDRRRESEENINRTAELRYGTEKRLKDLISSEEFKEEDKKGIDVPFFEFESIVAATDNFSDANKLGRGGFGPVYKGTFPGGREMAIKRLSNVSGQGLEEFKNEVVLIAKLQHRNLVRLLGYCIKGDEKLLIYEYMRNRSLDFFIFEHGMVLNWEARFNIILGVARGLLYLHQDSRLRIIHRDLKTGNILLDDEMNPKISDFGLARIFEGKQTEGTTNRVIGTYGYMSPEYALDGLFSVKSDAFSFGVVLLEILSGKRNAGYFQAMHNMSLLGYAWRLWTEGLALDLMDEMVRESCDRSEFLKCVNVALLCVQDDPADRPTMSNVVVMLSGETTTLPTPKQPAFVVTRDVSETTSSSKQEIVTSSGDQTLQEKA